MINNLKIYSKSKAVEIAKQIFAYEDEKYAEVFGVRVGAVIADTGLASFAQQIYAYVNNNKGAENKKPRTGKRKAPASREEEEAVDDEDLDLELSRDQTQDCYGCVAWSVPLSEGEFDETQ